MGLIRSLIGGLTGQGRMSAVDFIEAFRVNAEADAQRTADQKAAALQQLSVEFQTSNTSRFNLFMDGVNRLPRPAMALGVLGLFVSAMIDPEWFIARMHGLLYVPEPLWWLLGVIVSFYFGARFQAKEQHMLHTMARSMRQSLPEPSVVHSRRFAQDPPSADPTDHNRASHSAKPLENQALQEWRRFNMR